MFTTSPGWPRSPGARATRAGQLNLRKRATSVQYGCSTDRAARIVQTWTTTAKEQFLSRRCDSGSHGHDAVQSRGRLPKHAARSPLVELDRSTQRCNSPSPSVGPSVQTAIPAPLAHSSAPQTTRRLLLKQRFVMLLRRVQSAQKRQPTQVDAQHHPSIADASVEQQRDPQRFGIEGGEALDDARLCRPPKGRRGGPPEERHARPSAPPSPPEEPDEGEPSERVGLPVAKQPMRAAGRPAPERWLALRHRGGRGEALPSTVGHQHLLVPPRNTPLSPPKWRPAPWPWQE